MLEMKGLPEDVSLYSQLNRLGRDTIPIHETSNKGWSRIFKSSVRSRVLAVFGTGERRFLCRRSRSLFKTFQSENAHEKNLARLYLTSPLGKNSPFV